MPHDYKQRWSVNNHETLIIISKLTSLQANGIAIIGELNHDQINHELHKCGSVNLASYN